MKRVKRRIRIEYENMNIYRELQWGIHKMHQILHNYTRFRHLNEKERAEIKTVAQNVHETVAARRTVSKATKERVTGWRKKTGNIL